MEDLVAVGLLPELLDDLVDVRHLVRVKRQQRLLQCLHEHPGLRGPDMQLTLLMTLLCADTAVAVFTQCES